MLKRSRPCMGLFASPSMATQVLLAYLLGYLPCSGVTAVTSSFHTKPVNATWLSAVLSVWVGFLFLIAMLHLSSFLPQIDVFTLWVTLLKWTAFTCSQTFDLLSTCTVACPAWAGARISLLDVPTATTRPVSCQQAQRSLADPREPS